MPTKQHMIMALGVSMIIALFTMAPLFGASYFSSAGIMYTVAGGLGLFFGPLILCSIPAGLHWALWKESLNGNELSIWVFWLLSWFILSLTTIGEVLLK